MRTDRREADMCAHLRAEAFGECLHSAQGGAQPHPTAVEEHAQQRMGGARVWDQLNT